MTKRIKQTETLANVKVFGTNSTDTVTLATDLLSSTMIVQGTPTANIIAATWYGDDIGSGVTITRGGVDVLRFVGAGQIELSNSYGMTEDTNNTNDISVTCSGSGGVYLTIRKVSGYKTKIEPETFGQYDNPTTVGS